MGLIGISAAEAISAKSPRIREKTKKKEIPAISGISQSDIKAISENAPISALKAALQAAERSDWATIRPTITEIARISGFWRQSQAGKLADSRFWAPNEPADERKRAA